MDTADREKFQSLTAQYYRRTNIALLVCSLDDELSLNRLAKWQQEAQHYINDPEVLYAVCGTKSDLQTHEREVTTDMMHSFADHMEILQSCVFEISSKTGSEVKNMLKSLCSMTIERMMQQNTLEENSELEAILGIMLYIVDICSKLIVYTNTFYANVFCVIAGRWVRQVWYSNILTNCAVKNVAYWCLVVQVISSSTWV